MRIFPYGLVPLICGLIIGGCVDSHSGHESSAKSEAILEEMCNPPIPGLDLPQKFATQIFTSELTPSILIVSKSKKLKLFDGISESFGLGGPIGAAFISDGSPSAQGRGEIPAASLSESWILFWFSGAENWDSFKYADYLKTHVKDEGRYAFDIPILVSFQHKPSKIVFGKDGAEFDFPESAGAVQIIPFSGADRSPLAESEKWMDKIPETVLAKARKLNAIMKTFPINAIEDYRISNPENFIEVSHRFRFAEFPDEWRTKALKYAPLPPAISLASDNGFPIEFNKKPEDLGIPTQFGPSRAIIGADSFSWRWNGFPELLGDVYFPQIDRAKDTEMLEKIEKQAREKLFDTGTAYFAAGGAATTQGFKARMIPYVSEDTADKIRSVTMRMVNELVFNPELSVRISDRKRGRDRLVDWANHTKYYQGDDEPIALEVPRGLWEYAFYTGDFYTISANWKKILEFGENAFVKNDWLNQTRTNSGGDSFHDIIGGTAAIAKFAAVLDKPEIYGSFAHVLARHLIAYYNYEYAFEQYARNYKPSFSAMDEGKMLVWDIYQPFGPFFCKAEAKGFYGDYSGFYEHYARIGDGEYGTGDLFSRFYGHFPKKHLSETFEKLMCGQMPAPGKSGGEAFKWKVQFQLRSAILGHDYQKLSQWLDDSKQIWDGKSSPTILMNLYNMKNPGKYVSILPDSFQKEIKGRCVDLLVDKSTRHSFFDLDIKSSQNPGLFLFGFYPEKSKGKAKFHSGNGVNLGLISTGDENPGKWSEMPESNWVLKCLAQIPDTPAKNNPENKADPVQAVKLRPQSAEELASFSLLKDGNFENCSSPESKEEDGRKTCRIGAWRLRKGWDDRKEHETILKNVGIQKDSSDGKNLARITCDFKEYISFTQNISAKAGTTYRLSWLCRGVNSGGGAIRIRHYGFGCNEYAVKDFNWNGNEWKAFELVFTAYADNPNAQLDFWIMPSKKPDDFCEIRAISLVKSCWDAGANTVFQTGKPITLKLEVPKKSRAAEDIKCKILSPFGETVARSEFKPGENSGQSIQFIPPNAGYYMADATLLLEGEQINDLLGIPVIVDKSGIEGIDDFWKAFILNKGK